MKNNKGFSLVELIIVIAIMAILAAAIAPALIRYINKARIADDLTAAGEIVSACNTAMTNEDANDEVMKKTSGTVLFYIDKDGLDDIAGCTSFNAEITKTLPNGAKKKYVKDSTDGYLVTIDGEQFKVYAVASGTTSVGNAAQLNPSAASPYNQ